MKTETYVSIPQPCHENWEGMAPQEKGRFCASCAKTVVDFSEMSDTQVLHYLNQAKGRLCGRFGQDQLERPLQPVVKEKRKIWWMVALMPGVLLAAKANAQKKTGKAVINTIRYDKCERITGLVAPGRRLTNDAITKKSERVISGKIIDNDSIPIQGAAVAIKGSTIGTATDSSGNFQLSFPADDSSIDLLITAIGYEEKSFVYSLVDTDKIALGNVVLEPAFTNGLVVFAGGISYYHPVNKTDTIVHAIRKIFHIEAFKVYPNPVKRGAAINIDIKKEGNYSIQLLDAGSKLISTTVFDALKGVAVTSLTVPSSAAAGIYFIRLINDSTRKQYTEKIVVK